MRWQKVSSNPGFDSVSVLSAIQPRACSTKYAVVQSRRPQAMMARPADSMPALSSWNRAGISLIWVRLPVAPKMTKVQSSLMPGLPPRLPPAYAS